MKVQKVWQNSSKASHTSFGDDLWLIQDCLSHPITTTEPYTKRSQSSHSKVPAYKAVKTTFLLTSKWVRRVTSNAGPCSFQFRSLLNHSMPCVSEEPVQVRCFCPQLLFWSSASTFCSLNALLKVCPSSCKREEKKNRELKPNTSEPTAQWCRCLQGK